MAGLDACEEASEGCAVGGLKRRETCETCLALFSLVAQLSEMAPRGGGGFGKRLDGWEVLLVLTSTFIHGSN